MLPPLFKMCLADVHQLYRLCSITITMGTERVGVMLPPKWITTRQITAWVKYGVIDEVFYVREKKPRDCRATFDKEKLDLWYMCQLARMEAP